MLSSSNHQINMATYGNSATYFTRADEERIEELQKLLKKTNSHKVNENTNLSDPLALSVYESELHELQTKREKFIEEGLQNMMRASQQTPLSQRMMKMNNTNIDKNNNNNQRVFHAFDSSSINQQDGGSLSSSSSSVPGDGSASYLFTRMIGGFVNSFMNNFSSSSSSTDDNSHPEIVVSSDETNRKSNKARNITPPPQTSPQKMTTSAAATYETVMGTASKGPRPMATTTTTNRPFSSSSLRAIDEESPELAVAFGLGEKKQSDYDLAAAKNSLTTTSNVNYSDKKKMMIGNASDISSPSSLNSNNPKKSLFLISIPPTKLFIALAWSIFGACTLALFLQSLLHIQDPSRIRSDKMTQAEKQKFYENFHEKSSREQYFAALFHQESALSILLRLSEGFIGFLGSLALMIHLNYVAKSGGNVSIVGSGQQQQNQKKNTSTHSSNSTISNNKVLKQQQQQEHEGLTKRIGHSRSTSYQSHPQLPPTVTSPNIAIGSGNNNTDNDSTTSFPSSSQQIAVTNSPGAPSAGAGGDSSSIHQSSCSSSSTIPIALSTPVRILLKVCAYALLFFGVFALAYCAVLLAPLKYLSKENLLNNHIKKEQTMKHVEVNVVIYWTIVNFMCAFVTKQILNANQYYYS